MQHLAELGQDRTPQDALALRGTNIILASLLASFVVAVDARESLIDLMFIAGRERVITAAGSITNIGSAIGAAQGRVESVATRNGAETAALQLARNEIVAVDEYDSATALEALQTQMETLYTLTARLANLSLTDYMR